MNKSNILATISDLKAELKQINEQKQHLESSINSLYKLIGKRSQTVDNSSAKTTTISLNTKNIEELHRVEKGVDSIVPSYRVRTVLNNMQGRFLRSELYKNSSNDGHGPIAPGTFANIFAKLIKRKLIYCVDGETGQRNAVFLKADEYAKLIDEIPKNYNESTTIDIK